MVRAPIGRRSGNYLRLRACIGSGTVEDVWALVERFLGSGPETGWKMTEK